MKGDYMNYQASAVMSKDVISIFEGRDIKTAENLMSINKIRHLPVVNSSNELSGILSVKDVLAAEDKTEQIKTIMSSPVFVAHKTTSVIEVVNTMLKKKVSSILVVNGVDVLGILTTDDLLKLLVRVLEDSDDVERYSLDSFFDETWASVYP